MENDGMYDAGARLRRAESFVEQDRYEDARALLQSLLRDDPNHIAALTDLAAIDIFEGNFEKALAVLIRVLALDPADRVATDYVNRLRSHLGDDRMHKCYEKVLRLKYGNSGHGVAGVDRGSRLRISLVQTPRWNINQPPVAIPLLTGNLKSKGYVVFPKDYDIDFYRVVDCHDQEYWTETKENFWVDDQGVMAMINKYIYFLYGCVDDILKDSPDVIGFSVQTKSRLPSLVLAEKIKNIRPEVYIVLGGPEISKGPDEFLVGHDYVDAICMGEGDVSFPNFLENLDVENKTSKAEPGFAYREKDGTIVDGGPIQSVPRPEEIPFADYSDMDLSKYLVPNSFCTAMSRGCIRRCSFCNESPLFKKFRSFGAERAYEETRHIIETSNIAHPPRVLFNDSLMNGDLCELERFTDLLIDKPIPGLTYSGMMLIRKEMSDQLIEKLAKTGMVDVFFGVENGSEVVIKVMRKNFELADAERIVEKMASVGIRVTVFFMVGHPGETEEEFYKSLNFMRKLANHAYKLSANITQIMENSHIAKDPQKYGVEYPPSGAWVCDDGRITYAIRKQRQLIARAVLGDKAHAMGDGFDPLDPNSSDYYDQRRSLFKRIDELTAKCTHLQGINNQLRADLDQFKMPAEQTGTGARQARTEGIAGFAEVVRQNLNLPTAIEAEPRQQLQQR